jgi:pimeloyl-ACP methyl ester carboxylesterase
MRALLSILCLTLLFSGHARSEAEIVLYDQYEVNGHTGYLSAWAVHGPLDKVLLIVPGFDTKNGSMPVDELLDDLAPVVQFMGQKGWDVIYFDYVDGAIDLKVNADNLAHFLSYLDTQAPNNYHLAVIGGSMGGIVTRTMFVQEKDDMGVDTYVSIDSPHRGVFLSNWANDLASLAIDYEAAHQMHYGDPAFKKHYGWLRKVEATRHFKKHVNEPMNTCAIALSDGSQGYWKVSWEDRLLHNKYYGVSSYINYSGMRSTYMPYHSAVYLDSASTRKKTRWGYARYKYRNQTSSYFDRTIANPADEHTAPDYAIVQALDFILANEPDL